MSKSAATQPTQVQQQPPKEIKINKDDGAALKRTLDDAVIKYFTRQKGYKEDTTISNYKLTLSVISVALALTAQFYPAAFPDNYNILVVCCSTYFICSGILQLIAMYKEKDCILTVSDENNNKIHLRSSLPRFDYNYTLIMVEGKDEAAITKLVGNWFDEDGLFFEEKFVQDLKTVHNQLNRIKGKKST